MRQSIIAVAALLACLCPVAHGSNVDHSAQAPGTCTGAVLLQRGAVVAQMDQERADSEDEKVEEDLHKERHGQPPGFHASSRCHNDTGTYSKEAVGQAFCKYCDNRCKRREGKGKGAPLKYRCGEGWSKKGAGNDLGKCMTPGIWPSGEVELDTCKSAWSDGGKFCYFPLKSGRKNAQLKFNKLSFDDYSMKRAMILDRQLDRQMIPGMCMCLHRYLKACHGQSATAASCMSAHLCACPHLCSAFKEKMVGSCSTAPSFIQSNSSAFVQVATAPSTNLDGALSGKCG